jgi:ABC-type uncharacterized transport system ATPase subunit
VITGQFNIRRFEPRANEIQVISELLDKSVQHHHALYNIDDVAMELDAKGDWYLNHLHLVPRSRVRKLRTLSKTVAWNEVSGVTTIEENQGVATLLAAISTMRAADLAGMVIDLSPKRRIELLKALDDERLATVLEEMDES